jgi:hypothetical protein
MSLGGVSYLTQNFLTMRTLFLAFLAILASDMPAKTLKTEKIDASLIRYKSKERIELSITHFQDSTAGYFLSASDSGIVTVSSDSRTISGRMCIVTKDNILSGTYYKGHIVLYATKTTNK